MSRRLLRCRHPACPDRGEAVLGRLTADGGLVLDPAVVTFRAFLDTGRVIVACPACGYEREFRGSAVFSDQADTDAHGARQARATRIQP